MAQQVEVSHFTAAFSDRVILNDVSFSIPAHQFTVIVGENGAGKTTLIKALIQTVLGAKTTGRGQSHHEQIRVNSQNLAYVPQFRDLGDDYPLSIASFVALGLKKGLRPWLTKTEKEAIQTALAQVDLADLAKQRLADASGGQKQRAYIAQALVQNPDLLILDEPTAALDANHALALVKRVRDLQQSRQIGVLWISHDTSWVKDFADDYLWLHDGQVDFGLAKDLPDHASSHHHQEVNHV
ncbi:ABC-type Mn/Zn transport systems, ATPase component [Fructobacillus pseudoficulneus]|uniref:ABC-type Mn/Zn transport systems, ATPase component n=1 Tax=Fructobacillus pseudoficulneus TaxID=220714 RepID=A0A3F3GRV8_9LACO|nr:ATP-binding cassette domain-containing protein [Fructobacillus pseudoficulneus]GAP02384.1 ABC-type Mn/Zn transport systems, ATPase component [Fructobacillus pseudoficulneus]SEH36608.1 zinc/manganese transport system ATP-binding protein [Fructobacillus pseudoficulneus]